MAAPRNENLRETILDAAAALLRHSDFATVTLAQIAAAAGVSKGTLYYYYSNKDDILFDIADRYLRGLMDELLAWVDNQKKDTSLPRLLKYVLERGVGDEFGNLRLYLIGAGVSGHDALRGRYIELYGQFQSRRRRRPPCLAAFAFDGRPAGAKTAAEPSPGRGRLPEKDRGIVGAYGHTALRGRLIIDI